MRNKKLIPFETIEKAVAGEPDRFFILHGVFRHMLQFHSSMQQRDGDDILKGIDGVGMGIVPDAERPRHGVAHGPG